MSEVSAEKEMVCEQCGRKWVPSFSLDCYNIAGANLCEPCAFPYILKSRDPKPIDETRATNVCKMGQGAVTCAFLGMRHGFFCLKYTSMEDGLRQRVKEESMGARGDNCSGPPKFTILNVR